MKTEPLKCRCGGESHLIHKQKVFWYVRCEECRIKTKLYWNRNEAIEAWNKVMKDK